ncbi:MULTISPECIES: hypothetical protein [Streptomyces]|uniref:Uncharacterized protein n=2 Tax=Streptomyces nigrescens TaxID=1920 RepID=A0A640TY85_STRNI|nr:MULTISPECIES: hypothetical protein [Streptomyces]WAU01126.1 hypothetical protein STRLI_007439 [Streptomyces libani subsp. libani]WAU08992.1 hypothetical protein STRNI_007747 [Streptomyces nigrescens]GFE27025.1 hypothetical protein Sliba_74780 [Streptomyces libani subsp. libani]GGV97208.1 hypothetical protein GCM10010500_42280 [Streptomyces libani subsp. libani]
MNLMRMGVVAGALTTAVAFTVPVASAAEPELKTVNGHTDKWVNEATPTVEYKNGLKDTDVARVKEALEQCKSQSVSCASTTVGTPEKVTKWFDVENAGTGTGPLENCGPGQTDLKEQMGGMHAFAWGWNVGGNIDIELAKGVGIGVSAQYNETHTETKTGSIDVTVKPGWRGMLKVGHDMERVTSDVTIQGGKFGGAKISGVRTEIPLKEGAAPRAGSDLVQCGEKLLIEQ